MSPSGHEGPPREAGALVGDWRIDAVLADGATTLTYRVTDAEEGRAGVLRLLTIKDPAYAERLRRNAAALADHHDHLVPLLEVVEHNGFTGVVSQWIAGPDLGAWAQSDAPLGHRLALFEDVVAGLEEAHRANLVHRNLKPSKIRVSVEPGTPVRAFLEDFLLSRVDLPSDGNLTGLGVTFGTPQYMSPEQFHGAADVTSRGDLFSAGCVLYELATRKRAFDGTSIRDVYMAIIDGEYTDPKEVVPDLPDALVTLIRDLLEPATEDRPASAAEVLERLRSEPLISLVERAISPDAPTAPVPSSAPPDGLQTSPQRPKALPAFPTLLAPEEMSQDSTPDELPPPDAPFLDDVSAGSKTLWVVAGVALGGGLVASFLVVLLVASWWATG